MLGSHSWWWEQGSGPDSLARAQDPGTCPERPIAPTEQPFVDFGPVASPRFTEGGRIMSYGTRSVKLCILE